ncbi:hypothetical protein [Tateyamaria sp. SN3-11]|uniref:hypothetical protein n=1 Tax=Tateyamaria sp. SN3-11 TaxID=3092147 RepID=UPI0039E915EE
MADLNAGARVGSVSLGITVIALYGLFVALVTFGFGSYIYRTAWQADPIRAVAPQSDAETSHDIDNLLFILKREQDLERAKDLLTRDMQMLDKQVSSFDAKVNQSFAVIARANAALTAEIDSTMADLNEFQFDLPGAGRSKFESVLVRMETEAVFAVGARENLAPDHEVRALLDVAAEGFEGSGADLDTKDRFNAMRTRAIARLDELSANVSAANAASHGVQAERKAVQNEIAGLQDKWDGHQASIEALQVTLPVGSPARARLSALSLNIPLMPDVLMRLVSFPTIFLTLIVTIAAGGLGTVVAFSRRYYSSKKASTLTLSRLFVNVGEGIAAAIAIFLFSGAGMLALTQGGGMGNEVELSPYTVAFIAFLSGFMAEDAFASIQSAGKRIFKRDVPEENGTVKAPEDDIALPAP